MTDIGLNDEVDDALAQLGVLLVERQNALDRRLDRRLRSGQGQLGLVEIDSLFVHQESQLVEGHQYFVDVCLLQIDFQDLPEQVRLGLITDPFLLGKLCLEFLLLLFQLFLALLQLSIGGLRLRTGAGNRHDAHDERERDRHDTAPCRPSP